MKIVLGADHGGWQMKEDVESWLKEEGYEVVDVGAVEENLDDDYVDFAKLVVAELERDVKARGVLFCRNGFGMVMTANRFEDIRCGLGFSEKAIEKGRTDDDINCLAIPAEYVKFEKVKKMIKVFLEIKFSGEERYKRRLVKLEELSGDCCGGKCGDK